MNSFVKEIWMLGVAGVGLAAVAYGVMGIRRLTDTGAHKVEEEGEILTLYSMLLAGVSMTVFAAILTGTTLFASVAGVLLVGSLAMIFPRSGRMADAFRWLLPHRQRVDASMREHGAPPYNP